MECFIYLELQLREIQILRVFVFGWLVGIALYLFETFVVSVDHALFVVRCQYLSCFFSCGVGYVGACLTKFLEWNLVYLCSSSFF